MAITVTCICGKQLRAADQLAGSRGQCPRCGNVFVVPFSSSVEPVETPPPPVGASLSPGPATIVQGKPIVPKEEACKLRRRTPRPLLWLAVVMGTSVLGGTVFFFIQAVPREPGDKAAESARDQTAKPTGRSDSAAPAKATEVPEPTRTKPETASKTQSIEEILAKGGRYWSSQAEAKVVTSGFWGTMTKGRAEESNSAKDGGSLVIGKESAFTTSSTDFFTKTKPGAERTIAGRGLFILWPVDDTGISTGGGPTSISFHWRLRQDQEGITGKDPPQAKLSYRVLRNKEELVLLITTPVALPHDVLEGTFQITEDFNNATGEEALFWLENVPGNRSNILRLKLASLRPPSRTSSLAP